MKARVESSDIVTLITDAASRQVSRRGVLGTFGMAGAALVGLFGLPTSAALADPCCPPPPCYGPCGCTSSCSSGGFRCAVSATGPNCSCSYYPTRYCVSVSLHIDNSGNPNCFYTCGCC